MVRQLWFSSWTIKAFEHIIIITNKISFIPPFHSVLRRFVFLSPTAVSCIHPQFFWISVVGEE